MGSSREKAVVSQAVAFTVVTPQHHFPKCVLFQKNPRAKVVVHA